MVNKGVFNILKEKDPLGRVVGVAHVSTSQISVNYNLHVNTQNSTYAYNSVEFKIGMD